MQDLIKEFEHICSKRINIVKIVFRIIMLRISSIKLFTLLSINSNIFLSLLKFLPFIYLSKSIETHENAVIGSYLKVQEKHDTVEKQICQNTGIR